MSTELKEYAVVSNIGIDVAEIDADLRVITSKSNIPDRAVEVANPREHSARITYWWLADDEAAMIRNDDRVMGVDYAPDSKYAPKVVPTMTQSGYFGRDPENGFQWDGNAINWGIRREIDATNMYNYLGNITGDYQYALDGTGVDIVIMDTGLQMDHPEFKDANGVSRIQQIDWYIAAGMAGMNPAGYYDSETYGHGTAVASLAAGLRMGAAKNANIYIMRSVSVHTLIPLTDAYDLIRLWHTNKTNGRPTVVNMSFEHTPVSYDAASGLTGGSYRGTAWTWADVLAANGGNEANARAYINNTYGVPNMTYDSGVWCYRNYVAQTATIADVQELVAAGVHVVMAAGNSNICRDYSTGLDYNNYIVVGGVTNYYARPNSPYILPAAGGIEVINVGNVSRGIYYYGESRFSDSNYGPIVDIWAAGDRTIAACSTTNAYSAIAYGPNPAYKVCITSGTSFASPNVAGVAALYLQSRPDLTPIQLKNAIINDSKNTLYATTTAGYNDVTKTSGGNNRMLYNKYGINISSTVSY